MGIRRWINNDIRPQRRYRVAEDLDKVIQTRAVILNFSLIEDMGISSSGGTWDSGCSMVITHVMVLANERLGRIGEFRD